MEHMILLLVEIMMINIVLSGDNAIVIAMASRNLAPEQRKKAVYWGAVGAIVLRILLTVVAVFLLKIPFIQVLGALLLFYVAIKLVTDDGGVEETKSAGSVTQAIGIILAADFIMSLDNVVAVASVAEGNYVLMAIGIALSIPLIIWCSQLVLKIMNRFPILVYIGSGILGYTAGKMLAEAPLIAKYLPTEDHWFLLVFSVVCAVLVILCGWLLKKRKSNHKDLGTA